MEAQQQPGFLGNLWQRRVPQILGGYVAATFLAIEFGEWLTEQFALPAGMTTNIFLVMALMLPSVAVVAYFHGAPGKDEWTKIEKWFVPINILVAASVIWAGPFKPVEAEALTETKVIVDEKGVEQKFEVAKAGNNQRIMGFFWRNGDNDPANDWLSYAIPWTLGKDVSRHPLLTFNTPLGSTSAIEQLKSKNQQKLVGESLLLDLSIAKDQIRSLILTGVFIKTPTGYQLTASLYKVDTGELLNEWIQTGNSWLDAVDLLSKSVKQELLAGVTTSTVIPDPHVRDHLSSSPEAIQHMVSGLLARVDEGDPAKAIEQISKAVGVDPEFAEAYASASFLYRELGMSAEALEAIEEALARDYKLYSETRFILQANSYAIQSDLDAAIRVLEMWAQVHPDSVRAFDLLGRNYMIKGVSEIENAIAAFEKVYELNPNADDALLNLSMAARVLGKTDIALEYVDQYIAKRPEDNDALTAKAKILIQRGEFEAAREAFELSALLGDGREDAALGVAMLDIRQGDYDRALRALDRLINTSASNNVLLQSHLAKSIAYRSQGRLRLGIESLQAAAETATGTLPPIAVIMMTQGQIGTFLTELGETEQAIKLLEQIQVGMQPPFDQFMAFTYLNIYELTEDLDLYREQLDQAEAFMASVGLPFMDSFVVGAHGQVALWEERYEDAISKYQEALTMLRESFLSVAQDDNPLMEIYQVKLASAYRLSGQYDLAEKELNAVLTRFPSHFPGELELAKSKIDQQDKEGAMVILNRLLDQWSDADQGWIYYQTASELRSQLLDS